MNKSHFDLLIEAEQMRTILSSVKDLSTQSDGVMINGEVVSWEKAFPLISAFPDFQSTRQQTDEWMGIAASTWEVDFHNRIQKLVTRKISEKSTLENDNLYLWSLLHVTDKIIRRLLKYTDHKRLQNAEPETLSVAKDLLTALSSVTSGTQSTARIRNELFLSGIDNVFMEFQMLYTKAKQDGRNADSVMYADILIVIRELKEQITTKIRSTTEPS
ncbi:hypothetical protein [Xenorhabdus sp. KJ12.1]|uniref:hypothetical protein n=1 Tax=Xenorhabdus sp. KJ12.1 TaxID=1851571 RepID=UPI000C03F166|nr:hypothetical protein [Xenorhabdus sp. KJ12.1]PHM72313.1 hypothetical protein Xekj_00591 [Xenorhabdus sp. KJ12.1]